MIHESTDELTYSFVCPVCNEADRLRRFHERLRAVADELGESYEIIFINDGSTDATMEKLRDLARLDAYVRFVDFSRGFGRQAAVTAGYDFARGRAVVTMDVDGHHPAELIPRLIEQWRAGNEVVIAVPQDADGGPRRGGWCARQVHALLSRASGLDWSDEAGYCLVDRKVVLALRTLREQGRHVGGLTRWVGFRRATVPFTPEMTEAGDSRPSLKELVGPMLSALLSFSLLPLRLVGAAGALLLLAALLYLIIAGVLALFGIGAVSWLTLLVLAVGGVQLLGLASVAEYVGRIHEQAKGRPLYIVRHAHGFIEPAEAKMPAAPPLRQPLDRPRLNVMT